MLIALFWMLIQTACNTAKHHLCLENDMIEKNRENDTLARVYSCLVGAATT